MKATYEHRENWLRRLVVCNPLYLVSAVLVVLAIYLVTRDERFFISDAGQLLFNFSSLQVYEVALVVTAILLARRRTWYDSVLLVIIENVFVFVPFILVNAAVFMHAGLVWSTCLVALATIALRYTGLKRGHTGLRLGWRLLLLGVPFLAFIVV